MSGWVVEWVLWMHGWHLLIYAEISVSQRLTRRHVRNLLLSSRSRFVCGVFASFCLVLVWVLMFSRYNIVCLSSLKRGHCPTKAVGSRCLLFCQQNMLRYFRCESLRSSRWRVLLLFCIPSHSRAWREKECKHSFRRWSAGGDLHPSGASDAVAPCARNRVHHFSRRHSLISSQHPKKEHTGSVQLKCCRNWNLEKRSDLPTFAKLVAGGAGVSTGLSSSTARPVSSEDSAVQSTRILGC